MFTKSNLLLVLICLLGILFPLEINAQEVKSGGGKLTVHAILTGITFILTGIYFCFFGRRFYRPTLFLTGFYSGILTGWVLLTNGEPSNGYAGAASPTIILVVALVIGIIFGLLYLYFTNSAMYALGAIVGVSFALLILASATNGAVQGKFYRPAFLMVVTNLGIALTCIERSVFVIIATSFVGAYVTMFGIDLLARVGFYKSISSFMDAKHIVAYETNTKIYVMLAAILALFIICTIFQFKYNVENHFGPVPEPESDDGEKGEKAEKKRFWERRRQNNAD